MLKIQLRADFLVLSRALTAIVLSCFTLAALNSCLFAGDDVQSPSPDPAADQVPSESSAEKLTDELLQHQMMHDIKPLMQQYCFDCHTGSSAEAGVDLTIYESIDAIRNSSSVWNQVRGLIKIGAMPPPEEAEMPDDATREKLSGWIDQALHYVDCEQCSAPAIVTVRRLNAVEYDHAVADLFSTDLRPSQAIGFVTDEVGNGFDNQGETLTLSPLAIEKYLEAATLVSEEVISENRGSLRNQSREGGSLERGDTFAVEFDLAAGEYEFSSGIEFGFNQDFSVDAEVRIDGELIDSFEVAPRRKNYKWKREVTEGLHRFEVKFIDNEKISEGGSRRRLRIDHVNTKGPSQGEPRYPVSHRSVVIAYPTDEVSVEDAATQVVRNLFTRAYRRPADDDAVEANAKIIVQEVNEGTAYVTAIKHLIERTLASPEFFFRLERNSGLPANIERLQADVQYVEAYDLASRLSFMLWSSIPDDELLRLAGDGSLLDEKVLRQQVDRMIDDPRAYKGLVQQFFGQWLGLRNLDSIQVDQDRFPSYNIELVNAMRRETEMFCDHILKSGKLIDLLSADYTYANPRLAELYQLQFEGKDALELYVGSTRNRERATRNGSYRDESKFIQVSLDDKRRGLLTQASILTLTSNPTRTSPVKRGKWVLENIVGDPPPPAPPGVPALEDSAKDGSNMSLREQLELHRADASCASCHKVMDPIGLGLENFNTIGQFREKDQGLPIDAAGQLADGREFVGSGALLQLLLADEEKFARHFITKLLTFSLGRGLVREDSCTVDVILRQTTDSNFALRDIVKSIVCSDPFRYRLPSEE